MLLQIKTGIQFIKTSADGWFCDVKCALCTYIIQNNTQWPKSTNQMWKKCKTFEQIKNKLYLLWLAGWIIVFMYN